MLKLALFFLSVSAITPSAPSGNNGPTSKTFSTVYDVLGDKACASVTTEIECTEAQMNKEDELSLSKKNKFTIGECGDEFKKTCSFEAKHKGKTISWPITENNGNGCGEMVATMLMKDCSACDNLGDILTDEASTTEVVTHPTCEGNNGPTSKTFSFVYEVLGDKACVSATTEIECTEAQINSKDGPSPSENKFTIGECGDEFKKTCSFEVEHKGETISWPHTENNGNGCGEMVATVVMEDCSYCDKIGDILTHEASTTDVVTHPTCENVSDGFFNDFINKVKDGELLYIGIAAALVVVPLIFFLICCCCCMAAQPKGVTTYQIKSAV